MLLRLVADGLDVVSVGVEHEGAVIVLVIPAKAGRAVVGSAGGEASRMKCVDGRTILGSERKMGARTVRLSLMEPEDGPPFGPEPDDAVIRPLHQGSPAERRQRLLVEGATRRVVLHVHADMVEHRSLLWLGSGA